jgi:hypothetical protein
MPKRRSLARQMLKNRKKKRLKRPKKRLRQVLKVQKPVRRLLQPPGRVLPQAVLKARVQARTALPKKALKVLKVPVAKRDQQVAKKVLLRKRILMKSKDSIGELKSIIKKGLPFRAVLFLCSGILLL